MDKFFKTVSVFGYGRFGRLWADILAEDFKVKVYSRRGLKPEEVSKNVEITSLEDLFDTDAVFYCVAISAFEETLKISKQYLADKKITIFDTCSVKVFPVKWMKENLPENNKIIATHPMFGPDSYYSAKDNLPIVMCNVNAQDKVFDWWCKYFSTKKMRTEIMSPEQHDKIVAYSQGITHYVGRVLADLKLKETPISTLGYKKLLEIIEQTCNDSWQLFIDLQRFNPYTKQMRYDLHESLEKVFTMINNNHTS